jgi:polar amino acid transport system substrate-binding protein
LKKNSTKQVRNTFIVGTATGYAPFVSINEQGDYEGFDIDTAHKLAETMHKKLVLKDLGSMSSLLIALQQGSIDAIIWGMSITPERANNYAMIHYQGQPETSYPLIFWEKIPEEMQSLADMDGKILCAEPASAQYLFLEKHKNIQIMPTEKIDDALSHIRYKKAMAALVDPAIAKKFKEKHPEIQVLAIPLDHDNQVHGMGIMVNKASMLVKPIQDSINELKKNGTLQKYEKKWGL